MDYIINYLKNILKVPEDLEIDDEYLKSLSVENLSDFVKLSSYCDSITKTKYNKKTQAKITEILKTINKYYFESKSYKYLYEKNQKEIEFLKKI